MLTFPGEHSVPSRGGPFLVLQKYGLSGWLHHSCLHGSKVRNCKGWRKKRVIRVDEDWLVVRSVDGFIVLWVVCYRLGRHPTPLLITSYLLRPHPRTYLSSSCRTNGLQRLPD